MKLLFLHDEIPCARAVKDETAGTVKAFSENGSVIFEANRVTDFSLFTLEGGEWTDPNAEPTQLDMIEAQVTYTAMMTDTLLEV